MFEKFHHRRASLFYGKSKPTNASLTIAYAALGILFLLCIKFIVFEKKIFYLYL